MIKKGWSKLVNKIKERKFSVYIHCFPNGKQYVGMTSVSLKKRWNYGRGYISNETMNKDIKKYGWKNIEHIIVNDDCEYFYNEEEACYIEKDLIASWDLTNPEKGYNLKTGGLASYTLHKNTIKKLRISNKNKPVIQYTLNGEKIAEYISITEAGRITNINRISITKNCKGIQRYAGGFQWRYKEDNLEKLKPISIYKEIPVIQYTLDGKKINEYKSIKEAGRILKIDDTGIGYVCKYIYKTAGGFQWRYKEDNLESIEPVCIIKTKSVIQYTLDGEKIAEYISIAEAGRITGINYQNISRGCIKNKPSCGYIWEYGE